MLKKKNCQKKTNPKMEKKVKLVDAPGILPHNEAPWRRKMKKGETVSHLGLQKKWNSKRMERI